MKKYPGKIIAICNPDGEIFYGKNSNEIENDIENDTENDTENILLSNNDIELFHKINIETFFIKFMITLDIITDTFALCSFDRSIFLNTIYNFLNLLFALMAHSGVNTFNQNLFFPYLINFYIFTLINFIKSINCNICIVYTYFNNTSIISAHMDEYQKFNCSTHNINMLFLIFIVYIYQNFYNRMPQYRDFYQSIYYNNLININT